MPTAPDPVLPVTETANIAASASVTASSQNTASGQTAAKAVDGVIAGHPVDATREWATVGGTGRKLPQPRLPRRRYPEPGGAL